MTAGADWPHVDVDTHLGAAAVRDVLDLVDAVAAHDGAAPLSEHVILHLRHGGDVDARHLRIHDGQTLVGYAHLDTTDLVEGSSAELAVHPAARRRGIGRALVRTMVELSPDGRMRLWSHGERAAAGELAESLGFHRVRVLWQMRRSLLSALGVPRLPEGITLRTFEPGRDDAAWLALNTEAFSDLPDQGGWVQADLDRRIAEPWFDASGFLLAQDAHGHLAGFHWTKVHGHDPAHHHGPHVEAHDHEPIGEVYVVGVADAWRGSGLGRALVLAGLRHLRSRGLSQVMLYVDAANVPAIRLYESLGFTRWDTDVLYRRTPST